MSVVNQAALFAQGGPLCVGTGLQGPRGSRRAGLQQALTCSVADKTPQTRARKDTAAGLERREEGKRVAKSGKMLSPEIGQQHSLSGRL